MLRLLNPIRRLTASTYARGVAVMLVALTVGVLLTCNLCASRRYSVDEGEMVFIYGMPFAYRITRSLEAPPILTRRLGEPVTSDSRIAPPPLPAIMPFNLAAFAANAILAALIVLGLWFVVFHVLPRPSIKRSLNRGTVFLVAAGLVAAALFACVCALHALRATARPFHGDRLLLGHGLDGVSGPGRDLVDDPIGRSAVLFGGANPQVLGCVGGHGRRAAWAEQRAAVPAPAAQPEGAYYRAG